MKEGVKKSLLWIGLIFWGGWCAKALFDIIVGIISLRTDLALWITDLFLFSIGLLIFIKIWKSFKKL